MKKLRGIFKYVSYSQLSRTVAGYGYEYSIKNHMGAVAVSLSAMSLAGLLFYLDWSKIFILGLVSIVVTGVIVVSQFAYMANNARFEALANYMEMMILCFKRKPKILAALEQTLEYVRGHQEMEMAVERAISVIKDDYATDDVYRKAFDIIETAFPCSRLHTLHSFLLSVERESSIDYQESLDNLYFDIRSWITRTYQYQAELKSLKRKISIIIFLSVGIAAFFARLLHKAEVSMSTETTNVITGGALFQVSTLVFMLIFIVLYSVLQSKINGQWLINDMASRDDEKIERYLTFVDGFDPKRERRKSLVAALVCSPLLVAGVFMKNVIPLSMGACMILFCLMRPNMMYKSRKKQIERSLIREFPMWLREISVKLNNTVVVRAIEESVEDAATVLKGFLKGFVEKARANPTSITPYNEFLGKYCGAEMSTAFKTLYAVQSLSKDESRKYINDLVERNQTLIEKGERMRNEDSLAGVTFISLMPMLLMSFKLILDMGLLVAAFMSFSEGVV